MLLVTGYLAVMCMAQKETLAGHGDAAVLLVQVDSAANKVVSLVSSFGRIGSVAVPALCL